MLEMILQTLPTPLRFMLTPFLNKMSDADREELDTDLARFLYACKEQDKDLLMDIINKYQVYERFKEHFSNAEDKAI